MFYLFCLFVLCLSIITYFITTKYQISEKSTIYLFYASFPLFNKIPYVYYIIGSFILALPLWDLNTPVWQYFVFAAIFILLQCLIYIDIKCFTLPNKILLPLIGFIVILIPFVFHWTHYISAVYCFAILLFLALIRFNALGGGDVKLGFVVGALLGIKYAWFGLLLGFILGGVFIFYLYARKFISLKDFIPYGPFFVLATWSVFLLSV